MKHFIRFSFCLLFISIGVNALNAQQDALVITAEGDVQIPDGNLDVKGKIKENGNDLLPKGAIIMWSGTTVPAGWAICNEENNKKNKEIPNLSGRFIVGVGQTSDGLTKYNLGDKKGNETVTLTIDQMPSHYHDFNNIETTEDGDHTHGYEHTTPPGHDNETRYYGGSYWRPKYETRRTSQDGKHKHKVSGSTESVGNGKSQENRPPYYALYYIIKL